MLLPILVTVGTIALTCWLAFAAVRILLPRLPNLALARQASRQRIIDDPLDYVRAWVARIAPAQLALQQKQRAADDVVSDVATRETRLLTSFDGKEPDFRFTVTVITLFVLWIVSVVAMFLIDVPIINAVSGGNVFFGILGTALLLGIPIIGSVLLGHFFGKWRTGEIALVPFSIVATGILAAVVAVVALVTTLAPIRAEVEYADQIRIAQQQRAMYQEDGDDNAVRFAEQNLADLRAQQERSAQWNMALVPIAAAAEFATGFFFPLAVPLLMLADARGSRRKADRVRARAVNAITTARARQYARLSATFQRLGLPQLDLQRDLAIVQTENSAPAQDAATPISAARAQVAGQLLTHAPADARPVPTPAPERAIPAQIVTEEFAPAAPPARPEPSRAPAPRVSPAAARPLRADDADPDVVDESFDLS